VLLAFAPVESVARRQRLISRVKSPPCAALGDPAGDYLLTFVLAFAQRQIFSRALLTRARPSHRAARARAQLAATQPIGLLILLHLVVLFLAALLCHTRLATTGRARRT